MAGTLTDRLRDIESRLRTWRAQAVQYQAEAGSGMSADRARQLLGDLRNSLAIIDKVPRNAATAAKAAEEWNYSGPDIGADFLAIRNALISVGDRLGVADATLWSGYAIDNAYPWAETVPTLTDSVLQTRLGTVISSIDLFLSNIPES